MSSVESSPCLRSSIVSDPQIPILFAIAMGLDALVALVIGSLFDKKGTVCFDKLSAFFKGLLNDLEFSYKLVTLL